MTGRLRARLCGASIVPILLVVLLGCSAPNPSAVEPPSQPATSADGANTAPDSPPPAGSISIDPDWPWPASLPRPSGSIHSELTGPNAMGEGALYSLEFTIPSLDHAQAYADALRDAGLEWMLEGKLEAAEPGDTEMSVVAMTENYMSSLSVDAVTLQAVFSFMGTWA